MPSLSSAISVETRLYTGAFIYTPRVLFIASGRLRHRIIQRWIFKYMLAIHFERFPGWVAKLFLLLELLKQLDTQIHASIRVLALSLSSWVHGVDRRVHNWLLTLRSLIIEHGVVTELLKSILFHQLSKIAWSGARSLPCSIFCHFGISRINIHTMRRGNVINNSTEYIV